MFFFGSQQPPNPLLNIPTEGTRKFWGSTTPGQVFPLPTQQLLELVCGVGKDAELIPMGLSERGVCGVPTATPSPLDSRTTESRCCCCFWRASTMRTGRVLKVELIWSSLVSRLPICFSKSSLRSFSSVMRSYITLCICRNFGTSNTGK